MKLNKIINRWVALGISLLGIVALLILQFIWLKNAYEVSEQNLKDKCKLHLNEAIEQEVFFRAGTKINIQNDDKNNNYNQEGKEKYITQDPIENFEDLRLSLQDLLLHIGKECNLAFLDSVFNSMVEKNIGFVPKHRIILVRDSLEQKNGLFPDIKSIPLRKSAAIKKDSVPLSSLKDPIIIRLNSFQSIIIDITDPKANFVKTAKGYLILSIVLLLLTSYIFIFMMRSTLRENRFVRFIKEYTNALTHDLRSPLNSIHMASSIMYQGVVSLKPEEKKEYLRICIEQSKNMLGSIDRILTIAKAEHTNLVICPKVMPLQPFLLMQKEAYLNDMLHEKPVTITINCEPDKIEVFWDKELMENVVNNLMDNAVKYSYESVDITINSYIENNELKIQFSDNGMGIPPKDLEGIFKYFHQGSLLERKRMFGYGIGLSFMKKVVEAHQGRVSVESQENKGSIFTLTFPITGN
ncbi:MAG: Adaptive-response sensory-kinase SasA [Bacteroidetes bacterium ADurb.Bin416]|nr:MAG: Adaptive-response sensory-kinase SasA [Bacteroidetes bacterium ADurb.Bin416]